MKKRTVAITIVISLLAADQVMARFYEEGRRHYMRKEYGSAKEMFLKAAKSEGSGNAYYFLGEIEKIQGNYHEAEEHYKSAIAQRSTSRQYLINSYWSALVMAEQRHDYGSVVAICRSMWQRTGDSAARQKIDTLINKLLWTDNTAAIEKYQEGIAQKKKGDRDAALKAFQSALALDSSFLAPTFELGMLAYNGGKLDQASGYLENITARIPFYAEVQLVLADIHFRKFNYRAAISRYDSALEYGFIDPAAEYGIRLKRGTSYYNLDDYTGAEKEIELALRRRPGAVEALLLQSMVQIKLGKYDNAMKTLQRANAADPDNPEVQYQIGSIYYRESDGRYITHFDRLFSLAGTSEDRPSKYNRVFIILAKHHYENNKYQRAIIILNSLGGQAHGYETQLLLAKARFGAKEYDASIELFEGLSIGTEDKYMLCRAYAASGRREKAKALLLELSVTGDFLSRAKLDPSLSTLVREIEKGGSRTEPAPKKESTEGKTPEKKDTDATPLPLSEQEKDIPDGGKGGVEKRN